MNIDLGEKLPAPIEVAAPSSERNRVHYPSIYLRGGSELKAIPESGLITFRYNRIAQSVREYDGKKKCEIELECREITDVESKEGSKKSAGDALDALRKEVEEDEGY